GWFIGRAVAVQSAVHDRGVPEAGCEKPGRRPVRQRFFVAAVFLGGAAGAALAAGVVATRWFPLVYLVGAALAVPLTVIAWTNKR
ncbi:hypothetical protein, partial [Mycobacterium sp. NAZ190054]|uniref:hypothetical protein n=1 Tax=Mycobacterium sp. NAZ190054 TaxID=1747766 RepID=UPI000B30F5EF